MEVPKKQTGVAKWQNGCPLVNNKSSTHWQQLVRGGHLSGPLGYNEKPQLLASQHLNKVGHLTVVIVVGCQGASAAAVPATIVGLRTAHAAVVTSSLAGVAAVSLPLCARIAWHSPMDVYFEFYKCHG